MKASKTSSRYNLKLLAVFVAGLAVATLGWWESDRLNLAMGAESGINEIRGGIAAPTQMCSPGDKLIATRKYDGCNVVITNSRCNPNRRYVVTTKTKGGTGMTVYASPVKNSKEEVSYERVMEESRVEFKPEFEKVTSEVSQLQKTRPITDPEYQAALKYKKELDTMSKRCMPVPTITKPQLQQQKPVAR